jgi:hypothetical protein
VQENVLEKHPDADIRVYVVWLPVLATDERFGVANLLVDERATHFWDGDRKVGTHFAAREGSAGTFAWDVYYLFAPDAAWEDEPLSTSAPVVVESAKLADALQPYLD